MDRPSSEVGTYELSNYINDPLVQKAIGEVYEYCDSNSKNYYIDAEAMFKWLYKKAIKISPR